MSGVAPSAAPQDEPGPGTGVHILLTDSATAEDGQEVWPLYRDVFGDQPSYEAWTEQVWDRHRAQAVGSVTYLRAADNAFWGDQIDVPPALLENQWVELSRAARCPPN